jgi:hypothetical protein
MMIFSLLGNISSTAEYASSTVIRSNSRRGHSTPLPLRLAIGNVPKSKSTVSYFRLLCRGMVSVLHINFCSIGSLLFNLVRSQCIPSRYCWYFFRCMKGIEFYYKSKGLGQ